MSQVLELKNMATQVVAAQATINPDHVAWVTMIIAGAIAKAHKVARGDVYRNTMRTLSPVYRAIKEKNNLSGLDAYTKWYELGPTALKALKKALGNIQVAGAGP